MNREQLEALAKGLGIEVSKFAGDLLLAEVNRVNAANLVSLSELRTENAALKPKAEKHDVLLAENETLKKTAPDATKVVELSTALTSATTTMQAQATQIAELQLGVKKAQAATKVDGFITKGQIIPAQRETLINLAVESPATFDLLYTDKSPVLVDLAERGVKSGSTGVPAQISAADVQVQVTRYAGMIPGARK